MKLHDATQKYWNWMQFIQLFNNVIRTKLNDVFCLFNIKNTLKMSIDWCLNTIEKASIYKNCSGVPMLLDCKISETSNFETQIDRLISERKAANLSVTKLESAKAFIMKINELSDMKFFFKQY